MRRLAATTILGLLAAGCSPATITVRGTVTVHPENECRRAQTEAGGFPGAPGPTPTPAKTLPPILASVPVVFVDLGSGKRYTTAIEPGSVVSDAKRCVERGEYRLRVPRDAPRFRVQVRYYPVFSGSFPRSFGVSSAELARQGDRFDMTLELATGQ
ncbi:MAG TPA: hypothetical protein DIT48_01890 [Actinobacteria bacterium]|jgi:hypothetical protein|nr:hypothetical protein [Actinomycetota bacterium]HCP62916.1 hypothetical protein [Actinomycetota bacterium]